MELAKSIETIEAGYEFLLAFAAQGRPAKDTRRNSRDTHLKIERNHQE